MREHADPCGVARALDVVGQRWAMLVVRELLLGPKRFGDLHRGLGGMSQNVLSQRLRELEAAGVVRRTRLGPPAGAAAYELTPDGAALEPVLVALGRWGRRRPLPASGAMSADSLLLALRTTFDPPDPAGPDAELELRVGEDVVAVSVAGGQLRMARGPARRPAAVVSGDVPALRAMFYRPGTVAGALAAGGVTVTGDTAAVQRLVDAVRG